MGNLREGLTAHWIGSTFYFGRKHAGGVVVTGPMRKIDALNRVLSIKESGFNAEMAEETETRAAWFAITSKLAEDSSQI